MAPALPPSAAPFPAARTLRSPCRENTATAVPTLKADQRPLWGRLALALALGFVGIMPLSAQTVRLQTTHGDIDIELHADKAPATVANFLGYVRSGFYSQVVFHRVIDGFMIQTGGYDAALKDKPTRPPIPLESANGLSNTRGSVAMARTSVPNSATSQFFINVVDNPRLDKAQAADGNGYAVFGTVVAGLETVDRIRVIPTAAKGMHQNVPVEPVAILSATVLKP